jgi:hypothetical protein
MGTAAWLLLLYLKYSLLVLGVGALICVGAWCWASLGEYRPSARPDH